ncbi:MAG: DUF4265 domain-containing protein [Candidatus Tumulicola sp.]
MRRGKVAFLLEKREIGPKRKPWPPGNVETVWVDLMDERRAVIMNIPFYANGVSFLDEIVVEKHDEDAPFLTMTGVVRHSGNGTVRAILANGEQLEIAEAALDAVERLGCNFETGLGAAAVNIPPTVRPADVLSALEIAQTAGAIYVDVGFIPFS